LIWAIFTLSYRCLAIAGRALKCEIISGTPHFGDPESLQGLASPLLPRREATAAL
jgi:hypothetical protein